MQTGKTQSGNEPKVIRHFEGEILKQVEFISLYGKVDIFLKNGDVDSGVIRRHGDVEVKFRVEEGRVIGEKDRFVGVQGLPVENRVEAFNSKPDETQGNDVRFFCGDFLEVGMPFIKSDGRGNLVPSFVSVNMCGELPHETHARLRLDGPDAGTVNVEGDESVTIIDEKSEPIKTEQDESEGSSYTFIVRRLNSW